MSEARRSGRKAMPAGAARRLETRALDPKLVEFVKALARAAAREDHRRAAEAALPRSERDQS
ncbi:hypothetical protein [Methylocella sp.]|uniref:hypothetical protein n=1 Tax=Methylocella sp. TaxID=1978226 RepID=UPI0035B2A582